MKLSKPLPSLVFVLVSVALVAMLTTGCPSSQPVPDEDPIETSVPEQETESKRAKHPEPPASQVPGCPYAAPHALDLLSEQASALIAQAIEKGDVDTALANDGSVRDRLTRDPIVKEVAKAHPEARKHWGGKLTLKALMDGPSGTHEGYNIGQHTARALGIFEDQKSKLGLERLSRKVGVRSWENLVRMTLLVHDIGKPVAVTLGDKDLEETFSVPIAGTALKGAGMTPTEVRIAQSLIQHHQLIGSVLQDKPFQRPPKEILKQAADELGLRAEELLLLQNAIFLADAGSYPFLCKKVFVTDSATQRMYIREGSRLKELLPAVEANSPSAQAVEELWSLGRAPGSSRR
jgi:hypothetical protein